MKEFDLLSHTLEPATTLIEASAGTGKTYNIQHLYLRFIVEKNLTPDRLLVVTFSNEATAELKLRITRNLASAEEILLDMFAPQAIATELSGIDSSLVSILQDALVYIEYAEVLRRVQFALRAMDEAAILTIHSFCLRVLTDFAFESGALFGVELIENRKSLFSDLIGNFMKKEVAYHGGIEGMVLREFVDLEFLAGVPPIIYGKDDVEVLGSSVGLPNTEELYRKLQLEDILTIKELLIKKKRTKLLALINFVVENKEPAEEELFEFVRIVNSSDVKDAEGRAYFNKELPCEFQDIIRQIMMIPDLICFNAYKRFAAFLQEYYHSSTTTDDNTKLAFDDILYMTRAAIKRADSNLSREIRLIYSAVLVDEFQDTSGVQFDIFNSLFGNGVLPFFMIGDPKQSIYAFRGADIFSYLKAVCADGVIRCTLSKNFRSTPEYINALNKLFENRKATDSETVLPFIFNQIKYVNIDAGRKDSRRLVSTDCCEALEFRWLEAEKDVATGNAEALVVKSVASDIARKLNMSLSGDVYFAEGELTTKLKPSDFAVLVDTNRQGELIREELNRRGIVAVVLKSGNVFNSREAVELSIILNAIINSRSEGSVMAALGTRCFNYSAVEIAQLRENGAGLCVYWLEFFAELNSVLFKYGFLQAFSTFFTRGHNEVECECAKAVLTGSENGERAVTNYLQLVEILAQELLTLGGSDEQALELLNGKMREGSQSQEYEMRLESDEDAVKIMTIHKSKGLQFSNVYVPFLYKAISNFSKFDSPLTCNLPKEDKIGVILSKTELNNRLSELSRNERAEKMRLLYVALTRAVDKCIVYGGRIKSIENSPLADVLDRDFGRLKILSSSANIRVSHSWYSSDEVYTPPFDNIDLNAKKFSGSVERDWGVMSYSSLVSHEFVSIDVRSDETLLGSDLDEGGVVDIIDNLSPLPSSNKVGSAVHEIIEEYDFSRGSIANDNDLTMVKLQKYGVVESSATLSSSSAEIKGVNSVLTILSNLQLEDFHSNTFTLADIPKSKHLAEMSFYFPVRKKISTTRLSEFFKRRGLARYRSKDELKSVLAGIGIAVQDRGFREGFLYGLIDQVFEYNGRFYFADWKTNNLSRYGGYNSAAVLASMGESGYLLQFYIYTVALNLFLRSRIDSFDYNTHFGGGYYLYLRGLDLGKPSEGVFYEMPSKSDVDELIDIFTGGQYEF